MPRTSAEMLGPPLATHPFLVGVRVWQADVPRCMWRVECFAVDNAPASQAKSDVKFFIFEAAAVEVRAHRVPFDEAPLI